MKTFCMMSMEHILHFVSNFCTKTNHYSLLSVKKLTKTIKGFSKKRKVSKLINNSFEIITYQNKNRL